MRTRSQSLKEALEKAEATVSITMGEPVTETKALKELSQPKINDIQSSIVRPAIAANYFSNQAEHYSDGKELSSVWGCSDGRS